MEGAGVKELRESVVTSEQQLVYGPNQIQKSHTVLAIDNRGSYFQINLSRDK